MTDVVAAKFDYHILRYAGIQLSTTDKNALSFSRVYH